MPITIGTRLSALLEERNMNREELAKATNLTLAAIDRYITGTREPRAITVAALAKALEVKPADITGIVENKEQGNETFRCSAPHIGNLTKTQRNKLIAALMDVEND